jgi:hypothetical protein
VPGACAKEFPGTDEFAAKDRDYCEAKAKSKGEVQFLEHRKDAEAWRESQKTHYKTTLRVFNISREKSKRHEAYSFDDERYLIGIRGYPAEPNEPTLGIGHLLGWLGVASIDALRAERVVSTVAR